MGRSMSHQADRPGVRIADAAQFAMELASLIGIGLIGWHLGNKGIAGAIFALAFILLTGFIWGRFRTPGFVPTGREPTQPVSGPIRIAIELVVYLLGIFGIWWRGREQTALVVAAIMVATMLISASRYRAMWATRV
jgi:hypothetical protein